MNGLTVSDRLRSLGEKVQAIPQVEGQMPLFDHPDLYRQIVRDRVDGERPGVARTSIDAYRAFHEANPLVYDALVGLARRYRARHESRRLGIGMLFEVLRWNVAMETTDPDFKLNNNFRAFYAREIMEREADLSDAFEIREQISLRSESR